MTTDDERSVDEILAADISSAEMQAREIRIAADRLISDERLRPFASLIRRASLNFTAYADQCELTARRMRDLADQLGIEPPGPSGFVE